MLRRMESALVRKDAVMLHDPMRNHLRASLVGVILGVLGLAAFFVLGLFKPASDIDVGDIINVEGTTQIYVAVTRDQNRVLVPVPNVTSARLLVSALSPGSETPRTKTVDQSALEGLPLLPQIGLPDAPQDLPEADRLVDGAWSACDTSTVRTDLPNPDQELSTTAMIGRQQPGRPLGRDQEALLLEGGNGAHYLVWNGQRLPVDLAADGAVSQAFQLDDDVPRKVSDGLLNAIPPGIPLAPPDVSGAGDPALLPTLPTDVKIGDVVQVDLGEQAYFLILKDGKQRVALTVANLVRSANRSSLTFKQVSPEAMAGVPVAPESSQQNFAEFPGVVPRVLGIGEVPVACLVWPRADQQPVVTISADDRPLRGAGVPVLDADSRQADRVILEGGSGALVYGVVPGQRPGSGQIWLVTAQGQRYGVPSIEVAASLRLGEAVRLAPQPILDLLKEGPELNPQDALRLYSAQEEAARQAGR